MYRLATWVPISIAISIWVKLEPDSGAMTQS
jgi:hypothetical protein